MPDLFDATLTGGQTSPRLRHTGGRRGVLAIEVTALSGPVTFDVEASDDDGATWRVDHRCTMESPGRSVVPMRRGVWMRVVKSGARCTARASVDEGEVVAGVERG